MIPQIQVPALILWAEEDKYFPVENAYRFQEDIAGSGLVVYQDVAHLSMEEKPSQSAADFGDLLREHPILGADRSCGQHLTASAPIFQFAQKDC
ncbi:alpha/beta fold hydrolase [Allohahella sp. A8]|uniref:alpha/beta fold hydrolase n=1 Tax=Allohahella sp. A8 TaxID=3141461 RepID=UPI003A8128F2